MKMITYCNIVFVRARAGCLRLRCQRPRCALLFGGAVGWIRARDRTVETRPEMSLTLALFTILLALSIAHAATITGSLLYVAMDDVAAQTVGVFRLYVGGNYLRSLASDGAHFRRPPRLFPTGTSRP